MATTIYFVRHGKSLANACGVVCGDTDSPLSDDGREQAREAGEFFAAVPFTSAYASDLSRAHETGAIILRDRNIDIAPTPLLRERSYGVFEGTPYEAFKATQHPRLLEAGLQGEAAMWSFSYGDGCETSLDVAVRIEAFFSLALREHRGETILAATHGGLIRVLLIHAGWGSFADLPNGAVENTAFVEAIHDGARLSIGEVHGVRRAGELVLSASAK